MLDDLKKTLLQQAGKLMSSPTTMKLLANPNVQKAMIQFFTIRANVKNQIDSQLKTTLRRFSIVTTDELNKMKKQVQTLQANVDRMKREAEKAKEAAAAAAAALAAAEKEAEESASKKKSSKKKSDD